MNEKISDAIYQSILHHTMACCEIDDNIFDAIAGVPVDDILKEREGCWKIWGSRPRSWSIEVLCPALQEEYEEALDDHTFFEKIKTAGLDEKVQTKLQQALAS